MPTAIFKFKIKDGREADSKELALVVNANEPGVRFYQAYNTGEPGRYCFVESSVDDAASEAHLASEHFKAIRPRLFDCLDGPAEAMRLTDI